MEYDVETLRLQLATVASLLFDDYYVVARAIEINEEHIELLEMFQRIATARYAAGEISQQAPLQAEVEGARLIHRRIALRTERAILVARLNALLHRQPECGVWAFPSLKPDQVCLMRSPSTNVKTNECMCSSSCDLTFDTLTQVNESDFVSSTLSAATSVG